MGLLSTFEPVHRFRVEAIHGLAPTSTQIDHLGLHWQIHIVQVECA